MENKKNNFIIFAQKGFTMVEAVVSVAIFTVLIFLVSGMLNDIFVNSKNQMSTITNIDLARTALSTFRNEIRNALTGSDGSYALNQAGNSQIIFYTNFPVSSNVVRRIRYYVSGSSLYKGVVIPTGSPLTYNLSTEKISTVATGITNGSDPAFYYYDGDYYGTGDPLSQPVNINDVRFVKINLLVSGQTTSAPASIFSIEAGASIRSVKDNLGN